MVGRFVGWLVYFVGWLVYLVGWLVALYNFHGHCCFCPEYVMFFLYTVEVRRLFRVALVRAGRRAGGRVAFVD